MAMHLVLSGKRIEDSMSRVTTDVSSWMDSMSDVQWTEKAVHDIRILLRELKSFMYFYKPLIRKKPYRKGQKLLSHALKSFETARESAVLLSALTEYKQHVKTLDPDTQQEVLYPLEQWIDHFTHVHQDETTMQDRNGPDGNWDRSMENWISLMKQKPFKNSVSGTRTKRFHRKRIQQLMDKWVCRYNTLELTDDNGIHQSRIHAKRIRYMPQAMKGSILENSDSLLSLLASYQRIAGGLHDIQRFEEMLETPATEALDLARICFLAYENQRRSMLRESLGQVKTKLITAFMKNGEKK